MSDHWILIVPERPEHIPTPDKAKAALKLLEGSILDADKIEIVQKKHIQFFDCGSNLETITCPWCSSDIPVDWWGTTMSSDYDKKSGFKLNEYRLPCCSSPASLDKLVYDFHQAFGCFALSAMNPKIGKMPDDALSKIESALGCKVSVVYQHI